jgi:hypothetical protein
MAGARGRYGGLRALLLIVFAAAAAAPCLGSDAAAAAGLGASADVEAVARLGAARAAWLRARTLNASTQQQPGGRRLAGAAAQPHRRLAASPDPCPFTTAADLSALGGGPVWVGH